MFNVFVDKRIVLAPLEPTLPRIPRSVPAWPNDDGLIHFHSKEKVPAQRSRFVDGFFYYFRNGDGSGGSSCVGSWTAGTGCQG